MNGVARLREAVGARLGPEVLEAQAVAGGDVCTAFRMRLTDGRQVFAKTHRGPPPGFFSQEAAGLRWLGEAAGSDLAVVPVLGVLSDEEDGCDALLLPWLEAAPATLDYDERLGRGLALLHRSGLGASPPGPAGNLAGLPLALGAGAPPHRALAEERWAPIVALLTRRGHWDQELEEALTALREHLEDRLEPLSEEAPARLHGDLWSGNVHRDERGGPVLIDPAAGLGPREADLAMMRLFGGFGPRVFAAYEEDWPLLKGWQGRVPIFQVHPLLAHLALFGAAWRAQLLAALRHP